MVVQGSYFISVLSGSVSIYGAIINSKSEPLPVFAPLTHALPIIKPFKFDGDNENKIEIKISNLYTGHEKIGTLSTHFRSIWGNHYTNNKNNIGYEYLDNIFKDKSFFIIFNTTQLLNLLEIPDSWKETTNELIKDIKNSKLSSDASDRPIVILIIGSKSSGKSTFSKYLLNSLLKQDQDQNSEQIEDDAISYIDLDPGQPEFSPPDSISLSVHQEPVIGPPFTHPWNTDNKTNISSHYVGYSSPMEDPDRYKKLSHDLLENYFFQNQKINRPLIINTIGWIKGFGVELLKEIVDFHLVVPSHIVHLTPIASLKQQLSANDNNNNLTQAQILMNELTSSNPNINTKFIEGIFNANNTNKYSAPKLRELTTLFYFHCKGYKSIHNNISIPVFDDFNLLITNPPIQAPYETEISYSSTEGVSTTVMLGSSINTVNSIMSFSTLQASVVGIYSVNNDFFNLKLENLQNLCEQQKERCINDNIPFFPIAPESFSISGFDNYIYNRNNDDFNDSLLSLESSKFIGLAIIHSIDISKNIINIYTPIKLTILQSISEQNRTVLVRGKSLLPSCELYQKGLFDKEIRKGINLPYISFKKGKDSHVGGKARRIRKIRRGRAQN